MQASQTMTDDGPNEAPDSGGARAATAVTGAPAGSIFGILDDGPTSILIMDDKGMPVQCNKTFERNMGLLYKFTSSSFSHAAASSAHQERLAAAILQVTMGNVPKASVRHVEMTTLTGGDAGFPIRRHFDWNVGKGSDGSFVVMGDPVEAQSLEEREKDQELIDFFQNAPIALHWLNNDGVVVWCNQTELNVLGYTAEEYIGQPIMKFCPDDQELVLEMFKTLGTGNTIKDVPVRFRAKDGKEVHLLIDSNVKYDKHGKFGHTRCFIRDDTGRKINDAKAQLLLEETKRSLKMLDNFMSRSLHHMRTPLHVLQNVCDMVAQNVQTQISNGRENGNNTTDKESLQLLHDGQHHIQEAVEMINDISDLAKFDQGIEYETKIEDVDLKEMGMEIMSCVATPPDDVRVLLSLEGGGPANILSDKVTLMRVLRRLVDNAISATSSGSVALKIGYQAGHCTFSVEDTGKGLDGEDTNTVGTLPAIFQRYHQEVLPDEATDLTKVVSLRQKIEEGVSSHKKNSLGIGLSLSYHLVLAMGGDLRFSSRPGMTRFWFSMPTDCSVSAMDSQELEVAQITKDSCVDKLSDAMGNVSVKLPPSLSEDAAMTPMKAIASPSGSHPEPAMAQGSPKKRRPVKADRGKRRRFVASADDGESLAAIASNKRRIVQCGASKSSAGPSVLVVEDTDACAKLLRMMLTKLNCSTARAENGQQAIEMIQAAMPGMYDLILMDLRMPVMDGLEATRILKHEYKCTIPVVALTGEIGEDIKKQCDEIGFDLFCNKPMKRAQLKQVVERFTATPETNIEVIKTTNALDDDEMKTDPICTA